MLPKWNAPALFDVASLFTPVPMSVSVTVAFATTAPLESATVPSMVALSCPHARGVKTTIIMASAIQSTRIPFFDLSVRLLPDRVMVCVMVFLLRNRLPGLLYPTGFSCPWQSPVRHVR
jgi:hypothetical protein